MLHSTKSHDNSQSSVGDFDEQIKQLELEGNRLLAAANSLSDSLSTSKLQKSIPFKAAATTTKSNSHTASSLSLLADISDEHRTIEEIRAQLDRQSREAEHFSQRLLGRSPVGLRYRYSSTGSLLDKLELPNVTDFHHDDPVLTNGNSRSEDVNFATERKLRDAQNEILDLRTKLDEVVTISEKQKEHFRATVEDLRQQLLATNTSKDAVLRAKETELVDRESSINRLRRQIEQLELANKSQEKTLLEINEKLEVQQREHRLVESCLNQIRGQLLDQERKRGALFGSGVSGSSQVSVIDQDIAALVRSIDCCIQELDLDNQVKKEKIRELATEVNSNKEQFAAKEQDLRKLYEERMCELSGQHKCEMLAASEALSAANKRIASLEEQLAKLKDVYERHIQAQSANVGETESRLKLINEELICERRIAAQNKATLEKALDNAYCELVEVRSDRDIKSREAAALESRFADLQNTVSNLRTELEGKADEIRQLRAREMDLLARERSNELAHKKQEVALEEVQAALDAAQRQHDAQLRELVDRVEREGELNAVSQIESLSVQVAALTEKRNRLSLDLEITRGQYAALQERYSELRQAYESACHQLNVVSQSRDQLNANLTDRTAEVSRLTRAADMAVNELAASKSQNEKLSIQLEERERNFLTLKEQCDRLTSAFDSHTQRELTLVRERDDSERRLREVTLELEELRSSKESILQKMKFEEDRIQKLEEGEKSMKTELAEKKILLEGAEQVKETLSSELRDAKFELLSLKEQAGRLQKLLEQREGSLGQELNQLTQKLRDTERELRLSRKALKVHEETDEKAIEVAGKMQKEVTEKRSHIDTLYSKIHWLEDSLDIASKDKKILEETNRRLREEVDRATALKERLSLELRQMITKCSTLQSQLIQVEAAREKASLQQAAAQSQAEQFAQDIARLKFKQQLELKEMERTGQILRSQHAAASLSVTSGNTVSADNNAFSCTGLTQSYGSSVAANTALPSSSAPATWCSSSGRGLTREYPTSIKPSLAARSATYGAAPVGSELQQLLQEMRSALQVPQASVIPHSESPNVANSIQQPGVRHERSGTLEVSNFQSSERSLTDLTDIEDWSRDLPVREKGTTDALPSVFELITGSAEASSAAVGRRNFTDSSTGGVNVEGTSRRPVRSSSSRRSKRQKAVAAQSHVAPFDRETKAICDRLEKKIENLSRLGGSLLKDNQEAEKCTKEPSKKQPKIRRQPQK